MRWILQYLPTYLLIKCVENFSVWVSGIMAYSGKVNNFRISEFVCFLTGNVGISDFYVLLSFVSEFSDAYDTEENGEE